MKTQIAVYATENSCSVMLYPKKSKAMYLLTKQFTKHYITLKNNRDIIQDLKVVRVKRLRHKTRMIDCKNKLLLNFLEQFGGFIYFFIYLLS